MSGPKPFLTVCQICYAVIVPEYKEQHEGWHKDSRYMVVKVGENEWVAANDGGWTDGIYATESEAWEAAGGGHP